MQITLNGNSRTLGEHLNVSDLFKQLGIRSDQAVLELNGIILPPELYGTTHLNAGDSVELIQFVGGG